MGECRWSTKFIAGGIGGGQAIIIAKALPAMEQDKKIGQPAVGQRLQGLTLVGEVPLPEVNHHFVGQLLAIGRNGVVGIVEDILNGRCNRDGSCFV